MKFKNIPPRWDGKEQWYFVTCATKGRERVFQENGNIYDFLQSVRSARQHIPFRIGALTLLPDHWHGLIQTKDRVVIENVISAIKQNCLKLIFMRRKRNSFWQPRFLDHRIRNEQDFIQHYDYISLNAFKHGYVKEGEEYPWCFLQENPFRG